VLGFLWRDFGALLHDDLSSGVLWRNEPDVVLVLRAHLVDVDAAHTADMQTTARRVLVVLSLGVSARLLSRSALLVEERTFANERIIQVAELDAAYVAYLGSRGALRRDAALHLVLFDHERVAVDSALHKLPILFLFLLICHELVHDLLGVQAR